MIPVYRNIKELLRKITPRDQSVEEAFLHIDTYLIELNKLLHNPEFETLKVGEIAFNKDTNNLAQKASITQGCRVRNSTEITLTTAVVKVLNFDSERFDTDGMHDLIVNNDRITFRTAGIYMIGGCILYYPNNIGIRTIAIQLNGPTNIVYTQLEAPDPAAYTGLTINAIYKFNQGDYINLIGYQDSGGNLNIFSGDNYTPEFWAHRLS